MDLYDYDKDEDLMIFQKEVYHKEFTLNINPYFKLELNNSSMVIGVVIKNASKILKKSKEELSIIKITCEVTNNNQVVDITLSTQFRMEKAKKFSIKRHVNMDLIGAEFKNF